MSSQPILRQLKPADIPAALRLSTEAGWNQTAEDWQLLLELAPDGCFGIEIDGELASTATMVCYASDLAWIGMVLTHERYRGRGFAKRLLTKLISLADESHIRSVKLDATEQGQPVYEKFGFRGEQPVERSHATILKVDPASSPYSELSPRSLVTDLQAFAVDRSPLLRRLSLRNRMFAIDDSFVMTRPGRLCNYFGPCIASDPAAARALIERALSDGGNWCWDLFPANTSAVELAREFGFSPKRRLLRMVRGAALRGDERAIYALAGFELG
jgi:GNAT superfamily N-acetyltransferase